MVSSSQRQRRLARERWERRQSHREQARRRARRRRRVAVAVAAASVPVAAAAAGAVWWISGDEELGDLVTESNPTAGPSPGGRCTWVEHGEPAAEGLAPPPATPVEPGDGWTAELVLDGKPVRAELLAGRAPCAVTSLEHLAVSGYFDGTRCHRLTRTETLKVLQCGDPTGTGSGGPGYAFADENLDGATYPAGTLAMANSGPDTNGSQFFLVYEDSQLPPSYTVFGRVTEGLGVVRAIAARGVEGGGSDGAPARPVTLDRLTVAAA